MVASSGAEKKELLDCVLAHTAERIREFLGRSDIPRSGTKEVLRERLNDYLAGGQPCIVRLTEFLNHIEGWGNQHIYLYRSPPAVHAKWRHQAHVENILRENRAHSLFNRQRPVVLPDSRTLSCIRWSPQQMRFIWNEKRVWYVRREDNDRDDRGLVFRAYERRQARGTLVFDWDLVSGNAMIMIQRLPSGTRYAEIRDDILADLESFVAVDEFDVTRVNKGILSIQASPEEARERRINWETTRGGKAAFTSAGRRQSISNDQTLNKMKDAGKGGVQGSLGNFYWIAEKGGALTEELHVVLHKKDQRVAVLGDHREPDVRHVIQRIRDHSK